MYVTCRRQQFKIWWKEFLCFFKNCCVANQFAVNASAENPGTASDIQKQWDNLTTKQRVIYSNYQRALALTAN